MENQKMPALAEVNQEESSIAEDEPIVKDEPIVEENGYVVLAKLTGPWDQLFGPDNRGSRR